MPTLPAATDFTGASVTEVQFKVAIAQQREFLAGTVGTAGTVASALATMGALGSAWVSKTAAYTVLAADRGKLIGCSGTFSLTLTAAATLGDGFSFAVLNYGTGVVTLDPNSTELIDGASTITLGAGESCVVLCAGGTAWRTIGRGVTNGEFRSQQVFTASGTWNKPAGLKRVKVTVTGGGGAGGAGGATGSGGGGGAGGTAIKWIEAATLGTSESATVGAAGAASSFGAHASASAGAAGTGSGIAATGGAGGVGSGGSINLTGGDGSGGAVVAQASGGAGGASMLGGNGGGGYGTSDTTGGAGSAAGANTGGGGGGGGSGASFGGGGGAGGSGSVTVEEFF